MIHRPEKRSVTDNDFLSEIIIGMSDGLIVPFALTVGLSRVTDSMTAIANAGIVALGAGAIIMGFGGYLTGRSEMSQSSPHPSDGDSGKGAMKEKEQVKIFLANLGIGEELQDRAAEELLREKEDLGKKMAGQQQPVYQPAKTGVNIGLSYAAGGILPVAPYLVAETSDTAFKFSVVLVLISLPLLGYLRSRVTAIKPLVGILRTTIIGSLAGLGAFLVAGLFTS